MTLSGPRSPQRRAHREHDGVLTVACAASVWAQELDLMAEA